MSSSTDYAFPYAEAGIIMTKGMELRDWFASQYMTEASQWLRATSAGYKVRISEIAKLSYEMADAMLEARKGE